MAAATAEAVFSLRSRTGVSILECKKALEEAQGDEEKAIEILRKKGIETAANKSGREQGEGMIFGTASDGKAGLVLLKCETDFVARDENFQAFGQELAQIVHDEGKEKAEAAAEQKITDLVQKLGENISVEEIHVFDSPVIGCYVHSNGKIGVVIGLDKGEQELARDAAMHAAAMNPAFVSPEDIPEEMIAKEKEIWTEQLKTEGKPADIVEKIMIGKEKKFREENSLLKQEFVKDSSKTVEQHLNGAKVVEYIRVAIA